MPKRTIEDVENETVANDVVSAGTSGKPGKVVNLAYGTVNKEGVPIPCQKIDRPKIHVANPANQAFRVVAWNLNGMRAFMAKRSKELKKLWESEQLDYLGITETKITEVVKTVEIEAEIRKLVKDDLHFIWNMCSVKKGYSGSLVIVKKSVFNKCKSVQLGIGKTDPEGRVITLEFEHISVVLAYVPNSGQTLDRLNYRITTWDKELSEYVSEIAKSKKNGVILCGDLNVAIRDMDIWNVDAPHVPKGAGTTPQERNSFHKLFLNKGFVDTFAHMHPDKTGWFTYWSIRAGNKPKNRGLRLDYVLANKTKILDAYIATNGYAMDGDHCPVGVVAEIEKL